MKKIKIITSTIALLFVGAISTISIVACSKQNNQKTKINSQEQTNKIIEAILNKKEGKDNFIDWVHWWNSPFQQARKLAKDLDKYVDLTKSKNFKSLIDKNEYKQTFSAQIEDVIKTIKDDIKMYANSPFWKKWREQKKTALFLINYAPFQKDDNQINAPGILLPAEYPLLYAKPDFEALPGLGVFFPTPKSMDAVDILDTWKSFGSLVSSKGNLVEKGVLATKLQSSFAKTADKVVYIYDDAIIPNIYNENGERNLKITQDFANWMIDQDYKGYIAREFLKANQKQDLIPLPMSVVWHASYGIVGMHRMLYTLSKAFGMPKDELEHLKAQEKFKIPTLRKLLSNDELETKDGVQIIKSNIDSPFKRHRDQNRADWKIWATNSQVLDICIALGLKPDLLVKGELSTSVHEDPELAYYLNDVIKTQLSNVKAVSIKGDHVNWTTTNYEPIKNLNVNLILMGVHGLIKNSAFKKMMDEGKQIKNWAFTDRRFSDETRQYVKSGEEDLYSQNASILGWEDFLKTRNKN
ncbi:hypothetical protein LLZ88_03175 [Ureaplasma urealyticum]|uniref:hypothetical protein n=1 Tax=Ureaplasma urealyticum TaxID=2130 RepID=UPI001F26872E|nr:hypothetical protein [Ureaplasma urealyticum]UIU15043.1 hypothetical protein LLZ88_03175 [Ureaplasma urealyticum]